KDQCLIKKVVRLERLQHLPNTIVQRCHHRREKLTVGVTDVGNSIQVGLRSLIWRMGSVVCQVEEKRLCCMSINERYSLPRERICQIGGLPGRRIVSKNCGIEVVGGPSKKTK